MRKQTGAIALGALALVTMLVASVRADVGRGTIYKTTAAGGSPASYVLTVNDASDVAVGDHLIAYTSTSSGVWAVTATTATTITVREDLLEEAGTAFGAPTAVAPRNVFGFSTPGDNDLTLIADSSVAFASAALRRNAFLTLTTLNPTTEHDMLSATHGDSTPASATRGDLIVAQGASPVWARKAVGASGTFLRSDGTEPGYSAIGTGDLPTIPLTGGGTGATSAAGARTALSLVPGTHVQAYSSLVQAIADSTPTKGRILVGNGTTFVVIDVGTNGQVLTADSAQASGLTWSSSGGGGGTHQLLSATHPDTTTATVVRGDLITGQSGPTWNRLAIGASGRYTRSDGTDVTWGVLNMDDAGAGTLAVARGGTGGATAAAARTALDVQQLDSDLTTIAGLAHTAGYTLLSVGGVWTSAAPAFFDDLFAIKDNSDPTKIAIFQASGINTGTTRTFTLPNQSGTLALLTDLTATGDFLDTVLRVSDQADGTKKLAFETSGITTGNTRTLMVPDASGTIALTATTQPLDDELTDVAGLTPADNAVIIGNGSSFVAESGATLKTSLGLTIGTDVQAHDEELADVAGVTPTADQFLGGTGSALAMRTAAQVKTSLAIDHGADVTGLGDDDHTQYALLAGRSGGQSLTGGTASGNDLTLESTSHGTKGSVSLGSTSNLQARADQANRMFRVTSDSSSTNAVHELHRDLLTSGGTVATGFGRRCSLYMEDTGGATPNASAWDVTWTDAANGTQDAAYSFSLMRAGALTEAFAVNSLGQFTTGEWQATTIGVSKGGTGATTASGARSALGVQVNPATACGRLTASSSLSVTTTDTTSATLYYLPHAGNQVALYDGSTWNLHTLGSSGVSLDVSALTADQNYDVYIRDVTGTLTLSATAWSTHTAGTGARGASPPVLQDGAYVETGATSRRYLGTIRTVSSTGTKCRDALGARLIWNVANRVRYSDYAPEATNSWTDDSTDTWEAANANSTTVPWHQEFVTGLAGTTPVEARVEGLITTGSGTSKFGIALNWTSGGPTGTWTTLGTNNNNEVVASASATQLGFGFMQAIHTTGGGATQTFYGDNGSTTFSQSAMTVSGER
jgi:hypothetical protein